MCIFISITQVTGFTAILKTTVRQSSSSSYIGVAGAGEETLNTPEPITSVADTSPQCEFKP